MTHLIRFEQRWQLCAKLRWLSRRPAEPESARSGMALAFRAMRAASGPTEEPGCGKPETARSRLYRSQILQEKMRLKALAEIYTMHSFALL